MNLFHYFNHNRKRSLKATSHHLFVILILIFMISIGHSLGLGIGFIYYMIYGLTLVMAYYSDIRLKSVLTLMSLLMLFFSLQFLNLQMEYIEEIFPIIPIIYTLLYPGKLSVNLVSLIICIMYFINPGEESFINIIEDASEVLLIGFLATIISKQYLKLQKQINQLRYEKYHDQYTSLLNKEALLERFDSITSSDIDNEMTFYLLSFDDIEIINTHFGFDHGLQVIEEIIKRVKRSGVKIEELYRLSECTLGILTFKQGVSGAYFANNLIDLFNDTLEINYYKHKLKLAIGMVEIRCKEEVNTKILSHAAYALYHAKNKPGLGFAKYDEWMSLEIQRYYEIIRDVLNALKNDEFELYYQPKYDFYDKLIGAEALIRWNHPQKGIIVPSEFIPICEYTGLISEVGEWVINEACQMVNTLQKDYNANLTISINVSANQMRLSNFADKVLGIIEHQNTDCRFLELEITEGTIVHNLDNVTDQLKKLRQLGIKVAMDDFGIEYSSLSYLLELPIDVLKIDRSFINNLLKNQDSVAIVKMIITLAHDIGLFVLAEGVELKEEFNILKSLECDACQGYYKGRPMTQSAFLDNLVQTINCEG